MARRTEFLAPPFPAPRGNDRLYFGLNWLLSNAHSQLKYANVVVPLTTIALSIISGLEIRGRVGDLVAV